MNARETYGVPISRRVGNVTHDCRRPQKAGRPYGFLSVLHTWGQNLHLHPHLHCVVPGGGISPDGMKWKFCRRSFLLPVKVLGLLFRKKFLIYLRQASLSEVIRRSQFRCASALPRRITPDRVIAFVASKISIALARPQ
jgi:hypothetical protein